jgi:hypothetical protein
MFKMALRPHNHSPELVLNVGNRGRNRMRSPKDSIRTGSGPMGAADPQLGGIPPDTISTLTEVLRQKLGQTSSLF